MIKIFNEDYIYKPEIGINAYTYNQAEFEDVSSHYVSKSEDLIQGMLKNKHKFIMSKVLIERKTSSYEWHNQVIAFKGLFVGVESPKIYNTAIYVRKKRNVLSKAYFNSLSFLNNKVKMDYPNFEKYFDIYSNDEDVAKKLLTLDVMQQILEIHNNIQMDFEFTIKEKFIYIRFWCGEIFQIASINKDILDNEDLYKNYLILGKFLEAIEKIIDIINNNS